MPLFRADIQKHISSEYWTNRYFVQAADLGAAIAAALDIVAAERAIHSELVLFDKLRVDDNTEDTDVYSSQTLAGTGVVFSATMGSLLPLFCIVRVDFNVINGRPSRKYLRGCLGEAETEGGLLMTSVQGRVQQQYADVLAALTTYVDIDNQAISNGVVQIPIGMRQLRRGSKRKLLPVI